MLTLTDTARLVAFVDHTQITKVAWWPALTSPAPESGSIRTHSCGVTCLCFLGLGELGFGLGEVGFGLGFGELGFGLGVVVVELGVGVVVAGVDAEVLEGDEDVSLVPDVEGLDEGVLLADLRNDAEVLGETDLLLADPIVVAEELADLVAFADELADLNGDAEELASAAPGSWLAALLVADDTVVFAGVSGHSVELMLP